MKNEERLLAFVKQKWEEAEKPEKLPLSAHQIAKEFTIQKNKRTVIQVPVEVQSSHAYISKLLKALEEDNKLKYETTDRRNPHIRVL